MDQHSIRAKWANILLGQNGPTLYQGKMGQHSIRGKWTNTIAALVTVFNIENDYSESYLQDKT